MYKLLGYEHNRQHTLFVANLARHRYKLTFIDWFMRFAIAIPLVDKLADVLIALLICHYITVYGTLRRILTDYKRNFKSDLFAKD